MTGAARFAVAIVSHNTRDHLRACLKSVRPERPAEIVVVDNASSDGSAEMVRGAFPDCRLFANAANVGYGAAANQAIRATTAPFVLLLNCDTRLEAGALDGLVAYLDRNPGVAVVGPRLADPQGRLERSAFPIPAPLTLRPLVRPLPYLRDHYLRTWRHTAARSVPYVKGAALAMRREAFDTVGGFDESFFMYFEEVDLCLRLRAAGWEVHFAPVTTVTHVGEASADQVRVAMAVQRFASSEHFYRRHYSGLRLAGRLAAARCAILGRLVRDAVRLRTTRDPRRRAALAQDLEAWKRILAGRPGGAELPERP